MGTAIAKSEIQAKVDARKKMIEERKNACVIARDTLESDSS